MTTGSVNQYLHHLDKILLIFFFKKTSKMWPEWLECQNQFECKFFITFGLLHVSYHCAIAQFHATGKICKKVQEIVYWCGH